MSFFCSGVFLTLFFSVQIAIAQFVFTQQESDLPLHLQRISIKHSVLESEGGFVQNMTDTYLPMHLQKLLSALKDISKPDCLDANSANYAISLTMKGDYQGCYEYTKSCIDQSAEKVSIPLVIQGARCASFEYQNENAYQLFRQGLVSNEFDRGLASAFLIEFASMALNSNYASEVEQILNLHPRWNLEEKKLAKGLVEYLGAGLPERVTKKQVFDFVDQQLSGETDFYERYLKNIRVANYLKDYQFQKAYDYLVQDAVRVTNPLDLWKIGFQTLYAVANGIDFNLSKDFYLAYVPYTHDKLSSLPVERNVYNYTKIYSDVCATTMLQEPLRSEFSNQLNLWRSGKLSLVDLIQFIQSKPTTFLNKSDVMSTLGSLLSIQGQYDQARSAYWKAHQLCPFNNRSHWGIVLLNRRKKYQNFPEFFDNEKFVETTLQNVKFPEEVKKFIPNYTSFPEISRRRIQFAARIWAPYIQGMYRQGFSTYIKLPFELLSQVPGFSILKDSRIGPPDRPNYLFDNRLWDDVRGVGGRIVAADHDEVYQTVQGDYNLMGHEMAHQFNQYFKNVKPDLDACLNALHKKASERDVFADGYSKGAVAEYFAQGIGYYLIPATFPSRYGTNVSWFQKNDPEFYQFMLSIDQAGGDLNKIKCPVDFLADSKITHLQSNGQIIR